MTAAAARPDNLALIFQEFLTVVVRLRAGRQSVANAATFRAQVKEALRMAGDAARKAGYSSEHVRLAILAVVALLDETVLNSNHPIFQDWPRRPLQEELFGGHVAGETFYSNLRGLLTGDDAPDVVDVLEIYELCLLLGYQGRYSAGGEGDLEAIRARMAEKIARVRDAPAEAAAWNPPRETIAPASPQSSRYYLYAAAGLAIALVALFVLYSQWIASSVEALAARGS
jgi:type VI secretion system protein ImpK